MLNITGVVKVFDIEDHDKRTTARGVFGIPPKKDGGEWENDFINLKFVGKAFEAMSQIEEKTNIFIKSGILRNRQYTDKNNNNRTWLEVTVFEFCTKEEAQQQGLIKQNGQGSSGGSENQSSNRGGSRRGSSNQGNGSKGRRGSK